MYKQTDMLSISKKSLNNVVGDHSLASFKLFLWCCHHAGITPLLLNSDYQSPLNALITKIPPNTIAIPSTAYQRSFTTLFTSRLL